MRHNPVHATTDPDAVRDLVRANPWATIVSSADGELVASHYPVLLDEESEELALLTHVGRPDEEVHGFGDTEVLVIVQGLHGYVSPSWYGPEGTRAPTWNFSVAHCHGVPEVLGAEENLATLTRLVERFEREVEEPLYLDQEWGAADRQGDGRAADPGHPVHLQAQAEPGQGRREPAPGDREAARARPVRAPGARRRDGARVGGGARRRRGARVSAEPEIVVSDAPERKRFEVTVDGQLAGFLVYRAREGLIALIHTEVEDALRGPRPRRPARPLRPRPGPRARASPSSPSAPSSTTGSSATASTSTSSRPQYRPSFEL